jgi:hypothetical protein
MCGLLILGFHNIKPLIYLNEAPSDEVYIVGLAF